MSDKTAQEWVLWVYQNNPNYNKEITLSKVARISKADAVDFCQGYIKAMVKQDGKRNLLFQEKAMIKQLGLNA